MKFNYYALKLVGVCVVVFLMQIVFDRYGFTDFLILNGNSYTEIWRFVTSIFLHADITHIIYNMIALALFGSILEKIIGGKKFLLVFFLSGIIANVIAVNFYSSSLGASGAIYGVLGTLLIIRPFMIVFAFGLPMPMIVAGLIWVGGDLVGLFIPSNVGHIAHISGMMVGIIMGFIYRNRFREEKRIVGGIILDENKMRDWEDIYLR